MKIVKVLFLNTTSLTRIPKNHPLKKEFKYYTNGEMKCVFMYEDGSKGCVVVPRLFCTDGSSKSPDSGFSWVFHDYLYATHTITFIDELSDEEGSIYEENKVCTKSEADDLMKAILRYERLKIFRWVYSIVIKLDPLLLMTKAWNNSGKRGDVYFTSE